MCSSGCRDHMEEKRCFDLVNEFGHGKVFGARAGQGLDMIPHSSISLASIHVLNI